MNDVLKELRKSCLRLSYRCMDGNLQSAFSCIDIIWVLYDRVMNWSPEKATDDNRDLFVISKGQATLALFSVLIKKEFFNEEELNDIGSFYSRFSNQTDVTKFKGGIENSAGSLGHGLPMACGMAWANKIRNLTGRVFVMAGDGEFNEGTMWESCILAAGKKLDNLRVLIDDNNSVGKMIDMGDMKSKLENFGFDVHNVNGHDPVELEAVLNLQPRKCHPMAIIARTERGHGSMTMMKNSIWFHKSPNSEELEMLSKEVDQL
jgi:transketolase